jgi:arsenate reductase
MITVYHNPRCSKSREGLALVQSSGKDFYVREYLKTPLSHIELTNLIDKLGMTPMELVRVKEDIWKKEFKGKELNSEDVISALIKHPKLIERPIIEDEDKAIVGRPSSNIVELLSL